MTGTNHAMTGGVIALAIGGPIAIPIAFASHFALDTMPHFGMATDDRLLRRNYFIRSVMVDAVLLGIITVTSMIHGFPWYVYVSMLVAMSPDFSWIYRYTVEEKFGKLDPKPKNKFDKWHSEIQTMETVKGAWFEVGWFILMLALILRLV